MEQRNVYVGISVIAAEVALAGRTVIGSVHIAQRKFIAALVDIVEAFAAVIDRLVRCERQADLRFLDLAAAICQFVVGSERKQLTALGVADRQAKAVCRRAVIHDRAVRAAFTAHRQSAVRKRRIADRLIGSGIEKARFVLLLGKPQTKTAFCGKGDIEIDGVCRADQIKNIHIDRIVVISRRQQLTGVHRCRRADDKGRLPLRGGLDTVCHSPETLRDFRLLRSGICCAGNSHRQNQQHNADRRHISSPFFHLLSLPAL